MEYFFHEPQQLDLLSNYVLSVNAILSLDSIFGRIQPWSSKATHCSIPYQVKAATRQHGVCLPAAKRPQRVPGHHAHVPTSSLQEKSVPAHHAVSDQEQLISPVDSLS